MYQWSSWGSASPPSRTVQPIQAAAPQISVCIFGEHTLDRANLMSCGHYVTLFLKQSHVVGRGDVVASHVKHVIAHRCVPMSAVGLHTTLSVVSNRVAHYTLRRPAILTPRKIVAIDTISDQPQLS
eukprot:COSAG02_NODE_887_length_16169_cov_33.169011_7_plen_126_part_00